VGGPPAGVHTGGRTFFVAAGIIGAVAGGWPFGRRVLAAQLLVLAAGGLGLAAARL
jgi:hypothetical protein